MPKLYTRVTEWFDLADDPHNGRVEIAHLEPHEITAIVNRCTRTVNRIAMGGNPERVQEIDLQLDRQETVDRAVVNWEGFIGPDDKPQECTSENKRLWALDDWFMGQVREFRRQLAERVAEERAKAAKN